MFTRTATQRLRGADPENAAGLFPRSLVQVVHDSHLWGEAALCFVLFQDCFLFFGLSFLIGLGDQ